MDAQDRQAIEDLFDRLAEAERRLPQRDPEAEALIRSATQRLPSAPYYLAQTVVVQQQALEAAQQRIEELERGQGGFLSGMFGGNNTDRRQRARQPEPAGGPWGNNGGGFLAGAAQTAVGVAGGVLLGNMLAGALFGGGDAVAAEDEPADTQDQGADDFDGGGDFGGGDF